MSFKEVVKRIYRISRRELRIMYNNPIYGFCTILFPLFAVFFFTSLMNEGNPIELPIGVVDEDNTPTTRSLIQKLDAFQSTRIVSHYSNMNEARRAVQRNEIYGFLLIPNGTTNGLVSSHQPKISLYYSNVTLVAGSMVYKDLKTIDKNLPATHSFRCTHDWQSMVQLQHLS